LDHDNGWMKLTEDKPPDGRLLRPLEEGIDRLDEEACGYDDAGTSSGEDAQENRD